MLHIGALHLDTIQYDLLFFVMSSFHVAGQNFVFSICCPGGHIVSTSFWNASKCCYKLQSHINLCVITPCPQTLNPTTSYTPLIHQWTLHAKMYRKLINRKAQSAKQRNSQIHANPTTRALKSLCINIYSYYQQLVVKK